ncbi:LamG-like jellyroll fold domain-containing protein [Streptomyces sp. 4F14]|uniref:LamG-like jellyroll fold domain-containing protein n=1 Tax=Streptomyces sp. 4F14 TaxID=3394380 RepID=UPI003A890891
MALTVAAFPVPQASAFAADSDPAALSEGQEALAKAQESGRRVEVTGERTERTTVFANPDGYTFTLEESTVPVRVAKPDGTWAAPDATLEKRADGSVVPKAAAVQMALSAGGDKTPLARIEDAGRSLELRWPGTLPAPRLDGTSAVYADVLSGVDLKVTVTPESFQPVFVVKTPEAAASEAVRKLTFGMKADGLNVQEGTSGNLTAVDDNGRTVFRAPPARMWDSAGSASGPQTQLMSVRSADSDTGDPSDPSEAAPSGSGLEPGQGDAVARMDVEVAEDSLSVIPDASMLTRAAESAFPVFIDPVVSWGESERTLLRSDGYESYGWGNGDDDQGKGAGKCGTWNGYYCGPGYVQKLYFEFAPDSLKGKKVLDTTFRITEPWAFQCSPRVVDLVRTDNISSTTTWATRPKERDWMVDVNVSAGRGSLCDPDSPNAQIEFNDDPKQTWENLTPTVADFAAGKFSRLTLEVRAHDESDPSAWKRFKNDATLAVTFVGLPDKPTGVGLATGSGTACEKDVTKPAVVSDPEPLLRAVAQTKPGGEKDAQLRIYFDLDQRGSDGNWSDTTASNGSLRPSTGYAADNATVALKWSKLTDGTLYRYHAWTWSYYNNGGSYLMSPETTTYCYFKVDTTAPKAPRITIGAPYSECLPNSCAASGRPGQTVNFALAPNAAEDSKVASYEYKLSTETIWSPSSGQATFVPKRSGTFTFQARAKDDVGSGRVGATNQVDFLVSNDDQRTGRWNFSEASGAAVDTVTVDGSAQNATLAGGATRDDRGRRGTLTHDASNVKLEPQVTDKGLSLDGSAGHAATTAPVVDTRASYTVSAWVRLNGLPAGNKTVLAQEGAYYSGFYLSYQSAVGTWTVRTSPTDDANGNISQQTVVAKQPAVAGAWTHVATVYDASAKVIKLYVNGTLQGSDPVAPSWAASGPLQIGRALWRDTYTDYFPGSIDEVATWQSALTDEQIADEALLKTSDLFNGVEMVADWSAGRGSGTTVADSPLGYGKSLTLSGGATLEGDSIVFNGTDAAATTAGPVVDDSGSFTATTLVALDSVQLLKKDVGYKAQVLGQRTSDGSSWGLWYELTGKPTELDPETAEEKTVPKGFWHFGRLGADGTFTSVRSTEMAAVDSEVRLTGVFNSSDGTISLYLGSNRNNDAKEFTAQVGSGDFAVGNGFAGGKWQHSVPGRITEVKLWAGAMAGTEQVAEIESN